MNSTGKYSLIYIMTKSQIFSASPCVYLQLAGGNVATGKFIHSVVSTAVGGEYPQQ